MVTKTAAELRGLVRAVLVAAGASEANAERVAEALVSSNLSGVDSHGVRHVAAYVAGIMAGDILPAAQPEVVKETANSALVSGHYTFGHVAAKYATEVALAKAEAHGMAVVSLVRANHIGRLGEYAEMAAARGMVAIVVAGGFSEENPVAAPFGGSRRVLNTNPIAMGFPAGDEPAMVFDFATTVTATSKIDGYRDRGEQLPAGYIVDRDGNPTTDAAKFYAGGAHLPFGGHKGYALMMGIEYLGRIFSGSDAFAEPNRGGPVMRHQGATMIVFKADLFRSLADFTASADEMARRVRAVPPAPGFKEVLVPGDLEVRMRAARTAGGIPIADEVWAKLTDTAVSLGVPVP